MKAQEEIELIAATFADLSEKQKEWCKEHHMQRIEKAGIRRNGKYSCLYSLHCYSGDWHIVRNFLSRYEIYNRHKEIQQISFLEVSQWFFNVKTHKEHLRTRPARIYGDICLSKPIKYRRINDTYYTQTMADDDGYTMPNSRLHPLVRRNGLSFDKIHKAEREEIYWNNKTIIKRIFSTPAYETLIKSSQWRLAGRANKHIELVKLLLKHNIVVNVNEVADYEDTIDMLKAANKDVHNPAILREWRILHDRELEKERKRKQELDKRRALEQEIYKANAQTRFAETHAKYIGIVWKDSGMQIASLNNVQEYYDEGEAMRHCVGHMHYFDKDTVIFSVRDDAGKRLATVEYDPDKKCLLQVRAKCNAVPERYDEIVDSFKRKFEII